MFGIPKTVEKILQKTLNRTWMMTIIVSKDAILEAVRNGKQGDAIDLSHHCLFLAYDHQAVKMFRRQNLNSVFFSVFWQFGANKRSRNLEHERGGN